jgi:hypothetical protein
LTDLKGILRNKIVGGAFCRRLPSEARFPQYIYPSDPKLKSSTAQAGRGKYMEDESSWRK